MMPIDLYTKVVLIVIAIALIILIVKPLVTVSPILAAEDERFSHLQPMGVATFFDTKTGNLYYYAPPSGEESVRVSMQYRLEELGQPLKRIR